MIGALFIGITFFLFWQAVERDNMVYAIISFVGCIISTIYILPDYGLYTPMTILFAITNALWIAVLYMDYLWWKKQP